MAEKYSDKDLLKMISRAESSAFEYLYRKHFNMVKYFVENNSGSSEDAADLFQEILIIIYEKIRDKKLTLTCSLKTFIYSVSRNQWLKKLSAGSKKVRLNNFEDFIIVDVEPEERQSPELGRLFDEIGDACRKLLILFYYKKLSMEEISLQLNYSNADTAKNQKYKCIQRLKKMINGKV